MTRPPTVRDVASIARVSLGTMSNFLNDNKPIAPATRLRIEEAIARLGFIPNEAGRILRGGRSHAIAFLIPDASNPFLTEVARGIEDVAIEAGLVLVSCNTDGQPDREEHYARALSEMRVTGAVVVAMSATEKHLRTLESSGAAVVILGSHDLGFPSVDVDNHHGGYLAMQHVLDRGHRRLAFLGGPGAAPQIKDRLAGSRQAMVDHGLDASQLIRVDADGNTASARTEAALRILQTTPPPTAVICANDLLALALQTAAVRGGTRVPEDLAIVGYDDIPDAASAPVSLTTIRQPQYELGRSGAELVLSLAGGATPAPPQRFVPELVLRESA